ncbi:MAG: 2-hydroxyacyl-CoA dehydratase [Chitinispirillaceae bacterium]|nr:2-hydroxyacyl-CoA dehydratase [Chitinispirillaceae bacterium]
MFPLNQTPPVNLGIDIGSTTIKMVALGADDAVLFQSYERHNGSHYETLLPQLELLGTTIGSLPLLIAVTGSQGMGIAQKIGAVFIQEVIAQSIAVKRLYPSTRTSIELGGQDSKMVFYSDLPGNAVADMRMNGVCAGGTGAFIDQMSLLINIPIERFNEAAARGERIYAISGRCGVFAKTDIQPLLNQGAASDDIALSCLHALAKQTIGGLAQGMVMAPPVLFAGGPFFFIPILVDVFVKRLGLKPGDIVLPDRSQTFIAYGTALSLRTDLGCTTRKTRLPSVISAIEQKTHGGSDGGGSLPFFASAAERDSFIGRCRPTARQGLPAGVKGTVPVYIGLDAGSTTTKLAVIDGKGDMLFSFYANNRGKPVDTARDGLLAFLDYCEDGGIDPVVGGLGTTGYGENLFAVAFHAEYHTVETIAHKEAAVKFCPEVSFVLDLGGQDMKAIFIKNGIITNIVLNEACSAGCGSFLETYAKTLGIEPAQIASAAFAAAHPSSLGSRCTVFMNSSVITEQRNGRSVGEILAGLCRSIIENVFTKVIRIANLDELGDHIVVQGGTFKNDAVLKAFEDYIGRPVLRPPHCGEMGALGIALLCKERALRFPGTSRAAAFITREQLQKLSYTVTADDRCPHCSNNCARHIVTFSHGGSYVTGNRCERGAAPDPSAPQKRERSRVPDLLAERYRLLFTRAVKTASPEEIDSEKVIGIPRVLDFFDSFPFWNVFFQHLGYTVVLSGESNYPLFESGLRTVPSDTVCLPAKMAHGHIQSLLDMGVKTIFMPMMLKNRKENPNRDDSWNCAVLQGYPEIIRLNGCIPENGGVRFLTPAFKLTNTTVRDRQIIRFAETHLRRGRIRIQQAISKGEKEEAVFRKALRQQGEKVLHDLRGSDGFGVVIACRPYHNDPFVHHRIAGYFIRQGIPVLVNEALPGLDEMDLSFSRMDTINTFHNRMLAAAKFVAGHPQLEMVQLVSFGCGHDAILTDELNRILRTYGGKELLTLKLDEGENSGPLNIRITSFIETVRTQRSRRESPKRGLWIDPFPIRFQKGDRNRRIFLIPNLSRSFSMVISKAFERQGYSSQVLPVAGKEAIAIGKRYVNNDICYPAQINVGEILHYLIEHPERASTSAATLAKNCNDCRACHYAAIARKALDDAGFGSVPIVTTADNDRHRLHPGMKLNRLRFSIDFIRGIALIDAIDDMARRCRPYEQVKGQTEAVCEERTQRVIGALSKSWRNALDEFDATVDAFNGLNINRSMRKPRVGIIGEILVNFHESGNHRIVQYLEEHGMEVVLPNLIEFFRQDAVNYRVAAQHHHVRFPWIVTQFAVQYGILFNRIIRAVEQRKKRFFRYRQHGDITGIAAKAAKIIDPTFRTGEGWLIPGEIVNWIGEGISSFLIVQPFGCLPNHISGKGVIKAIRACYPHVRILTLDFDPDTSMANVHNRLQMLVLGARAGSTEREEALATAVTENETGVEELVGR